MEFPLPPQPPDPLSASTSLSTAQPSSAAKPPFPSTPNNVSSPLLEHPHKHSWSDVVRRGKHSLPPLPSISPRQLKALQDSITDEVSIPSEEVAPKVEEVKRGLLGRLYGGTKLLSASVFKELSSIWNLKASFK